MTRHLGRLRLVAAAVAIIGAIYMVWASTNAFREAGRYFARATYVAACTQTHRTGTPGQCSNLANERPHFPDGVETTDTSVLLTEGATIHSTGMGVLNLAGIWLAAWGIGLAATSHPGYPKRAPETPSAP